MKLLLVVVLRCQSVCVSHRDAMPDCVREDENDDCEIMRESIASNEKATHSL